MSNFASDFIRALGIGTEDDGEVYSGFATATIPASYAAGSGRPTLLFDGESTATTRTYPYLAAYTPAASDRVLIALVNHGGCILGKII